MGTKESKRRGTKGITLIALVVTIVVLLILAGVAISMLSGDDGIITNAQKASREQSHGAVREGMSLAYNEWRIEINTSSTTKLASTNVVQIQELSENPMETASDFLDYTLSKSYTDSDGIIDTEALIGTRQALGNGEGTNDVYKLEKINENYVVKYYENATNVLEIWGTGSKTEDTEDTEPDWDEIFENATKHPEQDETNETIGIDSDGDPVDMDNWKTFEDTKYGGVGLGTGYGSTMSRGYIGNVVDGKIDGEIPAYVKLAGSDKGFLPVTCMDSTFTNLDIVECPKLPSKLKSMEGTFIDCDKLKIAPSIPDTVENMGATFSDCYHLTTAPIIPNSVTNLFHTFDRCYRLTGELVINASNIENYVCCLREVATKEGCKLVLSGSCPQLQDIYYTAERNPNVTKK